MRGGEGEKRRKGERRRDGKAVRMKGRRSGYDRYKERK